MDHMGVVFKFYGRTDPDALDRVLSLSSYRFSALRLFNDVYEGLPSFQRLDQQSRGIFPCEAPWGEWTGGSLLVPDPAPGVEEVDYYCRRSGAHLKWQLASHPLILCLTRNVLSAVMWGHYASHGEGFCVGYDENCPILGTATPPFNGLEPVRYSIFRPLAESGDVEERIKESFLVKSAEWEYEHEVRAFRHSLGNEAQLSVRHGPEAIKQVIFGPRMRREEAHAAYLSYAPRLKGATFAVALLRNDRFDVEIVPIHHSSILQALPTNEDLLAASPVLLTPEAWSSFCEKSQRYRNRVLEAAEELRREPRRMQETLTLLQTKRQQIAELTQRYSAQAQVAKFNLGKLENEMGALATVIQEIERALNEG